VRVSTPLEIQLLKWSARAALSETDFLRISLVLGARTLALNMGLYRPSDDLEIDELQPYRLRGGDLPAPLEQNAQRFYINPTGAIPSEQQLDALDAHRKALVARK
jgi:hypothetical protein